MKASTENVADQLVVESRGIWATDGEHVSEHAADLFAELGRSLDGHRSQKLRRSDMEQVDVALVMTHEHRDALYKLFPQQERKVFLFSELATASELSTTSGLATDVVDPYGQSKEVYHATLLELKSILDRGWAVLLTKLALT